MVVIVIMVVVVNTGALQPHRCGRTSCGDEVWGRGLGRIGVGNDRRCWLHHW